MLRCIVVVDDVDDDVTADSHRIRLAVVPNRLAHSYVDMVPVQRQHVQNLDDGADDAVDDDDDCGMMVD